MDLGPLSIGGKRPLKNLQKSGIPHTQILQTKQFIEWIGIGANSVIIKQSIIKFLE